MLATAVALTAGPAGAAVVAFTGSEHNTTRLPQPSPACAPPAALVSFGAADDAVGTSNFGSFGTTQTHCIVLPPPAGYDNGHFSYAFARGDTLTGTYFGTLGFSATPGLLDNVQHFTVTGGIERSLGASGTFTGIGTLDLHPGANLLSQHDLAGTLTLPAAPEPAAWLLMIAGFGLVGAVARQQRAVAPRVTLAAARAR
ncbi:MAG: PEPxxWA-CTERM sorting domain-containing protein [Sphingomonadaceae bacterium]|nr:PEPxxWA-CTERM sorting domain-containing protein [Sphingomonadaceae bacterium]